MASSSTSAPKPTPSPITDTAQIEREVKQGFERARKRIEEGVSPNDDDGNDGVPHSWSWTDHQQVNEWAVSLLALETVKPSRNLHKYLQESSSSSSGEDWKETILPILNRTLLRLLQENLTDKPTRRAAIFVDSDHAQVRMVGDVTTPDKQLCRAVVAHYYHSLEAVLYCESERLLPSAAAVRRQNSMVSDRLFHRALLACCILGVTKAIGVTGHKLRKQPGGSTALGLGLVVPVASVLRVCECDPYDFLKVSRSFRRGLSLSESPAAPTRDGDDNSGGGGGDRKLGSPLVFALPRLVDREIAKAEVHCLDALVWATRENYRQELWQDLAIDGESLGLCERIERRRPVNRKEVEADDSSVSLFWWPPAVLVDEGGEDSPSGSGVDSGDGGSSSDDDDKDDTKKASSSVINTTNNGYPSPDDREYPEYLYISYLFRNVLQLANARITALCDLLSASSAVANRTRACFVSLLRNHVDVLYDRHLDPWLLCCLYGVSKISFGSDAAAEEDITFCRILDSYVQLRGPELGEAACQRLVRQIPFYEVAKTGTKGGEAPVGDVIQLYNRIFLPKMRDYLRKTASSRKKKRAIEEEQRTNDVDIRVKIESPSAHAKRKRERLESQVLLTGKPQTVLRFGNAQPIL